MPSNSHPSVIAQQWHLGAAGFFKLLACLLLLLPLMFAIASRTSSGKSWPAIFLPCCAAVRTAEAAVVGKTREWSGSH